MGFLEQKKNPISFFPNKNDPWETAQNKEYVFETSMIIIFLPIFLILKGLFISAFVSAL